MTTYFLLALALIALLVWLWRYRSVTKTLHIALPTKRVARFDAEKGRLVPIYDPRFSLGVLLFDCETDADSDLFLASGITSELIRYVTQVPDIRVNTRATAFSFRTGQVAISDVAKQLNARYIVSGSLMRRDGKVLISTQLHDTEVGLDIWTQIYQPDADAVFDVQADIAQRIVGAVLGELKLASTLFAGNAPAQQLDAWGLVNKAYYFWLTTFKPEAILEACSYLRQALEIDPDYTSARAALAMLLAQQMTTRICKDYDLCVEAATEQIEKAYAEAPDDVEVLENAGVTWQNLGQSERSIAALRKAVSIAPLNLIARGYLALSLSFTGGEEGAKEAIELIQDNFAIAPQHPSTPYWNYFQAVAEQRLGNNERAIELAELCLQDQPAWIHGYFLLANAYSINDERARAGAKLQTASEISPYLNARLYVDNIYRIVGSKLESEPFVGGLLEQSFVT